MPRSRIPSPARSQGVVSTPRRHKSRGSRSVCSPTPSSGSGRLTSIIDQFKEKNLDSFALSPVNTRKSVLTDNTDIEEPRRKSWWKNLNENSRDVMEALVDNKATEAVNAIEDIVDVEILSQEKKNYTLDLPESSDNESINSIVIPQRKLFSLKENQPQKKFGQLVGARETLAKLHKTQNDKTINAGTKDLFQATKRSRPVFPAALLNISPNKTTADKTKENAVPEPKPPVRNIFGSRPANKRKNIFADFIVSESEDDISDIQPKVFGFQNKGDQQKRGSFGKGRDNSPTSSITTDIEMDEWKHLPSSTMVEHQLDEMVTRTPVKRARLSKLSEVKESEAGTYYTTVDKTRNITSPKDISNKISVKGKSIDENEDINNDDDDENNMTLVYDEGDDEVLQERNVDNAQNKNSSKVQNNITNIDKTKTRIVDKTNVLDNEQKESEHNHENKVNVTVSKLNNSNKTNKSQKSIRADKTTVNAFESNLNKSKLTDKIKNSEEPNEHNELEKRVEDTVQTETNKSRVNSSRQIKDTPDKKAHKVNEEQTDEIKDMEVEEHNEKVIEINEGSDKVAETQNYNDDQRKAENECNLVENLEAEANNSKKQNMEAENHEDEKMNEINEGSEKVAEREECNDEQREEENEKLETEANSTKDKVVEKLEIEKITEIIKESDKVAESEFNNEDQKDGENENHIDESNEAEADSSKKIQNVDKSQSVQEEENEEQEESDNNEDVESDNNEVEESGNNEEDEESDNNEEDEEENVNLQGDEIDKEQEINQSQDEVDKSKEIDNDESEDEEGEIDKEKKLNKSQEDEVHQSEEIENDESEVEEAEKSEDVEAEQSEDEKMSEIDEEHKEVSESEEEDNDDDREEQIQSHLDESVEEEADSSKRMETDKCESDQEDDSEEEESDNNEEDAEENVSMQEDDEVNESHEQECNQQDQSEESDNEQESENVEVDKSADMEVEEHEDEKITEIENENEIVEDKTKEAQLTNMKHNNTSIRKTKSIHKDLSIRPSLAPPRDSLGLSDGTRDSSAEGSGWDSHRTTRKTLRQTFGKDFTPRKSLRALVMEKAAKHQAAHVETLNNDTVKFPQANSTEYPEDNVTMESDHELSRRTRQTTLETYLQKIKQENVAKRMKMEEAIRNSLKAPPPRDPLSLFKMPSKPIRKTKAVSNKPKKTIPNIFQGELPPEVVEDMKYKPPKRFQPTQASWITKRLYKYLERKLEPKYDYKARVRAEKLVETIFYFVKELRRHKVASPDAVEVLKHEMARLDIVKTHFEFYEFFHEFMPREVIVKVNPDIVNNIALPRHGVFSDIIRGNNG